MTAAPDYADLVRRLRGIYRVGLGDPPEFGTRKFDGLPPIQGEAADAIESLAARVERQAGHHIAQRKEIVEHKARIAALERERDELRADFERYAQHTEVCDWAWAGTQEFKCSCGLDTVRARWAKATP